MIVSSHSKPQTPVDRLDDVMSPQIRERLAMRARPWASGESGGAPSRIERKGAMPGRRRSVAVRSVCAMIKVVAAEMVALTSVRDVTGTNRRFALAHVQQISIYVCHVVLQLTMTEIARAVGRDRTTIGHACARVEDRRDDRAYDQLIAAVERVVANLFLPARTSGH